MIPNATARLVSSSPVAASGEFGISVNDTAHIMSILRDQLYTDKVLAVLREYGANAWDAHRDSGKGDVPIKVTLPTVEDPTLSIRDYGEGLSPDQVFRIYTQYGASTKRNSDVSVGMLGIGSKSGFAYSDSFTITSHNGGMKRMYVAVLDASNKGVINLLHEEPSEETGIEITMAVRQTDINEFHDKASRLFQHFNPRPDITPISLPDPPPVKERLTHGVVHDHRGGYYNAGWQAIMGCVPYRVDLDQVSKPDSTPEGGIPDFFRSFPGIVHFDIGEVEVSASREELKYSAKTKLAVVRKMTALIDEYVKKVLDTVMDRTLTWWERRRKAQLFSELDLPVPLGVTELVGDSVYLRTDKHPFPKSFTLKFSTEAEAHVFYVRDDGRFILRDDTRPLRGFTFTGPHQYLVCRTDPNETWDTIVTDLNKFLEDKRLTGVPVVKLSELPWTPLPKKPPRKKNVKHRVRAFELNLDRDDKDDGFTPPWGTNWDAVDRIPEAEDVYLFIENFKSSTYDFKELYNNDKEFFHDAGLSMPRIYGYKSTDKNPYPEEQILGTEYREWRIRKTKELATPERDALYAQLQWKREFVSERQSWRFNRVPEDKLTQIKKDLGSDHGVAQMIRRYESGRGLTPTVVGVLLGIETRAPKALTKIDTAAELKTVYKKYPLLAVKDFCIADLWGDDSKHWLHYIHAVDTAEVK